MMDSREQFEALLRKELRLSNNHKFARWSQDNEQYATDNMQLHWIIWQHQQAKIDAMKAMMKKHGQVPNRVRCPECLYYVGHAPDCEWEKQIKE